MKYDNNFNNLDIRTDPIEPVANDITSDRDLIGSRIKVGYGSKSFSMDERGFWLGGETPSGSPMRVDMQGRMILKSTKNGGYILIDAENTRIIVNDGVTDRILIGLE